MAKTIEVLKRLAAEELGQGEELVSGLRVNLKGTAIGVGLSSLVPMAGSSALERGRVQAEEAGIAFAQQMALGLTPERIIVWERSPLSGKPTTMLGSIPLEDVIAVTFESGFMGDRLTLKFLGDTELELEAVKVDRGAIFAEKVKESIASAQ